MTNLCSCVVILPALSAPTWASPLQEYWPMEVLRLAQPEDPISRWPFNMANGLVRSKSSYGG